MDQGETAGLLPMPQDQSLEDQPTPRGTRTRPWISQPSSDVPNVFVKRPAIIYSQFLVLLLSITSLSLAFCFAARFAAGGTRAPPSLAKFITSNPRLTTLIVAIISTTLTATVNWARGGSAILLAQKRLRRPRQIFEIEILSALTYGYVAWTWKRRSWTMVITLLIVVTGGFLTSGFVALLTPFPIAKRTGFHIGEPHSNSSLGIIGGEMDLNSPLASCAAWVARTSNEVFCPGGRCGSCERVIRYPNSNFVYTSCNDQISEIMSAARSAMIYRFASIIPPERQSNLLSSFTQLANTRIIGTTSGTLPTGPAGVHPFTNATFPRLSETTSSYNYTLQLQGIWATVSCKYVDKSQSKLAIYPDKGGLLSYNVTCPDRRELSKSSLRNETKSHGLILAGACLSRSDNNITLHLRSFVNAPDYDNQIILTNSFNHPSRSEATSARSPEPKDAELDGTSGAIVGSTLSRNRRQTQETRVYAGIDAMECTLMPRVGRVEAMYQTDLGAFNMTASESDYVPLSRLETLGWAITQEAVYQTINIFVTGQSSMAGNAIGREIRSVGTSYANLDGTSKSDEFTLLVADALKGIFEYKVTWLRLIFNGANPEPTCRVAVTGNLTEQYIGWHTGAQTSAIIALIPMILISFSTAAVIIWTMRMKGGLTVFDPTSTVSLIAATSTGEVEVLDSHHERRRFVIGDPEDEIVRSTEVRYEFHRGRWGLRSY